MIFDGKKFAQEIEESVKTLIKSLKRKPKIVSILVGSDDASSLYTKLKNQAAERVGIEFEILRLENGNSISELGQMIMNLGEREGVDGIMIQLPIPGINKLEHEKILSMIPLHKDVDGLRWEQSGVKPATVSAVLKILQEIGDKYANDIWSRKFAVLGARGAVGRPLVNFLRSRGVEVSEIEWDTKNPEILIRDSGVVISCVGKAGIVSLDMIGSKTIVVDVGMSSKEGKVVGDMDPLIYQKASVAVPVPGGVGPVTIACLLQNVLEVI